MPAHGGCWRCGDVDVPTLASVTLIVRDVRVSAKGQAFAVGRHSVGLCPKCLEREADNIA